MRDGPADEAKSELGDNTVGPTTTQYGRYGLEIQVNFVQ